MEKDHIMEKREPHDAMNLFKEVQQKILFLRNQEVILDADVAELYGVETKRINEAVKNNTDKFPDGYMFKLTHEELIYLRSKNLTTNISSSPVYFQRYLQRKGYICWQLFSKASRLRIQHLPL